MQWSLIFVRESVLLLPLYTVFCRVLWSTAPDVYAVVRCETDAIRSRVFKAEGNPEFNLRAIFYRRYPDAHISIEVWHIHISNTCSRFRHFRGHARTLISVSCAVVEQRSAAGLGARRGSAPDGGVREEPEARDGSARPQRARPRRDVLQRLPHRLVTV